MLEPTPDERLRAFALVHNELMVSLWTFVLAETKDPEDETIGARDRALEALERDLETATGREFTVTRELAITQMEDFWRVITAEIAAIGEPLEIRPTAYGQRLARRISRGEPPADASGEEPG